MTYRELQELIAAMPDNQKDSDVTVYIRGVDEYYPTSDDIEVSTVNNDVFDPGQPYMIV
jgi:hypothetical protein